MDACCRPDLAQQALRDVVFGAYLADLEESSAEDVGFRVADLVVVIIVGSLRVRSPCWVYVPSGCSTTPGPDDYLAARQSDFCFAQRVALMIGL